MLATFILETRIIPNLFKTTRTTTTATCGRLVHHRLRPLSTTTGQPPSIPPPVLLVFRGFASFSKRRTKEDDEDESLSKRRMYPRCLDPEDPAHYRHPGIQFHPESISQYMFPDKTVHKEILKGGTTKNIRMPIELEHGYFWMLRELRHTNNKPIVANPLLIPEKEAHELPPLTVTPMAATNKTVLLPDHLIQQNRSNDPAAQCTIVAHSCRQYGYSLIPSWIEPIREMYGNNTRVQTVIINASEGGWLFRSMAPLLKWLIKKNTREEDRECTYLHYGNQAAFDNFRNKLGCHNVMTCYVHLLDGLGQVRWAASGPPTPEEIDDLLHKHIPQLLPRKQSGTTK
ncbi:hypothetical protein ACA910_013465 [Epithemia clementina (nom. ined.)]